MQIEPNFSALYTAYTDKCASLCICYFICFCVEKCRSVHFIILSAINKIDFHLLLLMKQNINDLGGKITCYIIPRFLLHSPVISELVYAAKTDCPSCCKRFFLEVVGQLCFLKRRSRFIGICVFACLFSFLQKS